MATILNISDLPAGVLVQVRLSSLANSSVFSRKNFNNGLFRVLPGGKRHSLNHRDFRRILGVNRRKFLARVMSNDTVNKQLIVSIAVPSPARSRKIHYEVVLAYGDILRLSRLVPQDRTFVSLEKESAFRRQHRARPVNKAFFDPKDRFVPVNILL